MSKNKKIIISAMVLAVALAFWLSLGPWLKGPLDFGNFSSWITPVITLSLLLSLLSLSFLLINDRNFKIILSSLTALSIILVFGLSDLYILAMILIFLFNFSSMKKIEKEKRENVNVRVAHILRRGLPSIITPLLIGISFAYFLSSSSQNLTSGQDLPPAIGRAVESVSLKLVETDAIDLPLSQESQIADRITSEFMSRLSGFYKQYSGIIPPLLAFGLFLVLKGMSFIFIWSALGLSLLIFEILKKLKIILIETREITAEKLVFKP